MKFRDFDLFNKFWEDIIILLVYIHSLKKSSIPILSTFLKRCVILINEIKIWKGYISILLIINLDKKRKYVTITLKSTWKVFFLRWHFFHDFNEFIIFQYMFYHEMMSAWNEIYFEARCNELTSILQRWNTS